ncbi:hypothetical protein D3C76_976590 [compost metagenome]
MSLGRARARASAWRFKAARAHDQRVHDRQPYAIDGHANKGRSPAKMARQHSAKANAEHGTDHAPGQEGPRDRGPLLRWKDAQHHGQSDAAIGRFADADEEARDEHFLIVGGETAHQGGQAPDRRHQNQAADASQAIGDHRQRKGQHTDGNGDDAGQRAQLGIGEAPFGLELRKNHRQHLPRHEV